MNELRKKAGEFLEKFTDNYLGNAASGVTWGEVEIPEELMNLYEKEI